MKYIMLEQPGLFPNGLIHEDVAKAILSIPAHASAKVVSAGEVTVYGAECGGKSSTLDLKAGKGDSKIIESIDYLHGIL